MLRVSCLAMSLLLCAQVQASSCELSLVLKPQLTHIDVELALPVAKSGETPIGMNDGWAGVTGLAAQQVEAEGGVLKPGAAPGRWTLQHTGPARIRYRVKLQSLEPGAQQKPLDLYRPQAAADHFQVFGYGLMLLPELGEREPREVCLRWEGVDGPVFNSFGMAKAGETQRFRASNAQLRHAFYASGDGWRLQQQVLPDGGLLHTAVRGYFPNASDRRFAQAAAQMVAAQRRYWRQPGEPRPAPQWLLMTPTYGVGNFGGTRVTQASVLHVPAAFAVGSADFEKLVAHENLHDWLPHRFGARGPGGLADVPGYWFGEGFTDFFTHRLLLAGGLWSLDDYAARMTQRTRRYLDSPQRSLSLAQIAPRFFSERAAGEQLYLRGEFLALRWEAALRETTGAPSLSALLRGLVLPAEHRETQLAHERVLGALRSQLGESVDVDLQRIVTEGEVLKVAEFSAGPCLVLGEEQVHPWTLGFDSASFKSQKAAKVDPQGPAYAAGLREGMSLSHWSVHFGDVTREVLLQAVGEDGKLRDISYSPVAAQAVAMPIWRLRAGAAQEASCQRWMRLED